MRPRAPMHRLIQVVAVELTIVLLTLLSALSPVQAQQSKVDTCPHVVEPCCTFRNEALQRHASSVLGTGFHIWPIDVIETAEQAAALKPSIVRYATGPYWRDLAPLPVDASLQAVRGYVSEAFALHRARWMQAAQAVRRLGASNAAVEELLIIWEPPLSTRDKPDLRRRGSYRSAEPDAVRLNARFYLASIEETRRLGFRVDMVEIANEPDGSWNMKIPPAVYADLLVALREEAAAASVPLPKLVGPGLAFLRSMRGYFSDPQVTRRILGALDIVSVHTWDDRKGDDVVAEARHVRDMLDRLGWSSPIMVSEFAPTFPRPADREQKIGPDQRLATGADKSLVNDLPRYAPSTIELALSLAANGYGPLIYWEFKDQAWGSVSYGLLDRAGRPRPAYGAWQVLVERLTADRIDRVATDMNNPRLFGLYSGSRLKGISLPNTTADPFAVHFATGDVQGRVVPDSQVRRNTEQQMWCGPASQRRLVVPAETSTVLRLD